MGKKEGVGAQNRIADTKKPALGGLGGRESDGLGVRFGHWQVELRGGLSVLKHFKH